MLVKEVGRGPGQDRFEVILDVRLEVWPRRRPHRDGEELGNVMEASVFFRGGQYHRFVVAILIIIIMSRGGRKEPEEGIWSEGRRGGGGITIEDGDPVDEEEVVKAEVINRRPLFRDEDEGRFTFSGLLEGRHFWKRSVQQKGYDGLGGSIKTAPKDGIEILQGPFASVMLVDAGSGNR